MKIKYEDNEYFIGWNHGMSTLHKTRATTCYIKNGDRLVVEASSVCAPEDNFSKETGRKLSLTRALRDFRKSFRKAAWEKYGMEIGF